MGSRWPPALSRRCAPDPSVDVPPSHPSPMAVTTTGVQHLQQHFLVVFCSSACGVETSSRRTRRAAAGDALVLLQRLL